MALKSTTSYLEDSISMFEYYKRLGEGAMAQVTDEQLQWTSDPESNSIAIIVKHLAGNMRSRWKDFLVSDGEKPDRNRDTEFEAAPRTRAELMEVWNNGWAHVFTALSSITEADLQRTVYIRSEPHSVMQAINRQVAHYAYHVGQIVTLARQLRGTEFQSLSVPRGQSQQFNAAVSAGNASQR